ncbi:hypothetical protein F5B18DRAFT_654863 [Nemania serpens]|nr:hypothetical protein F5B18DRAFT_654863 [Nemania serpens]
MVNQQENSPLFRLEDTIRFHIFQYYLVFTEDDFTASSHPIDRYIDPATPYSTACDQYGDRCYGFAVHGVLRLERLTYLSIIVDMPFATWPMWLYKMEILLPRMTSLVHVTIDWAPYSHIHGYDTVQTKIEPMVLPFFRLFTGLPRLQTIYLFGQVPFHWKQLMADETRAVVRILPYGWWKRHNWEDPNIRYRAPAGKRR